MCPGKVLATPAEINNGDSVTLSSLGASVICYSLDKDIFPACHASDGLTCTAGEALLITDNTGFSGVINNLYVHENKTNGGTLIRAVGCSDTSLENGLVDTISLNICWKYLFHVS